MQTLLEQIQLTCSACEDAIINCEYNTERAGVQVDEGSSLLSLGKGNTSAIARIFVKFYNYLFPSSSALFCLVRPFFSQAGVWTEWACKFTFSKKSGLDTYLQVDFEETNAIYQHKLKD